MNSFLRDLRYGVRLMAAAPVISAIAVVALALGIGANTAIFSVVNAVLLARLPVEDPDSLVLFVHRNDMRNITSPGSPYSDVTEWRRQVRSVDPISAWQPGTANLLAGEQPERIYIGKVNHTFFPMVGVRPVLGRAFLPEEDRPGEGRALVITHELWNRRFAANPDAVGATVSVDGVPHTVVGVLPPRFRFTGDHRMDAYAPIALPENSGPRIPVMVYGRLKKGAPPAQLHAELEAATAATVARLPRYSGWHLRTKPVEAQWIAPDIKGSLWVLLGAVGLVLLIACANVASLLLSRAEARRREVAIRTALGAGRGRIIRQLMAESLPLALAGGAAGLLLAWWGVELLPGLDASRIPRLQETRIDGAVLAFTAAVSLLTTLLFGLAPAVSLSRFNAQEALKEGSRAGGAVRGSRMRAALVAAEVALALLLSIGATLMMRTFYKLSAVNPGFNPENLFTASLELPRNQYRTREQVTGFFESLLTSVQAMPGVKAACLTNSLPLGGAYYKGDFRVEGKDYQPGEIPVLNFRNVDSNYFRTLQIPLRRGRLFTERDRFGAEPVIIINETTARRFFGDSDPIGRRIGNPGDWMTVVGVVADVKHTDVALGPDSEVLLPFAQKLPFGATIIVRLDASIYPDPLRFAPLMRRAVQALDRNQAMHRIAAMDKIMADRLTPRRLNMLLLAIFAGVAVLLAAVGIYGVLSFSVERRTHEIGVRMALGARDGDVVRMVVRQAMVVVAGGLAAGLAAAAALTRLMQSILYGVSPTDPAIYAGAAVLLTAVAGLASWVPARRATRVDPLVALRCE